MGPFSPFAKPVRKIVKTHTRLCYTLVLFRISRAKVGPCPTTLDLRGTQWPKSAACAGIAHMYKAPKIGGESGVAESVAVPTALVENVLFALIRKEMEAWED